MKRYSKERLRQRAARRVWKIVRPIGRVWRGLRFVGSHRLTELGFVRGTSFAQFGEDLFVYNHFKHVEGRQGFYVDVGAYHPYRFSNTYLFYRHGWRGINIEPNPRGYDELLHHRPRDVNLNIAISTEHGEAPFVCDDAYSGIDDEAYLYSRRNPDSTRTTVRTKPLAEVLDEHLEEGQAIDFMTIDCEGHDLNVIRSNDWTRFRPRLLLVEDHEDDQNSELNRIMSDLGYRRCARIQLTKVFVEEGGSLMEKEEATGGGHTNEGQT